MKHIKTKTVYHGECRNKFLIENSEHLLVYEVVMEINKEARKPAVFNTLDDAIAYIECMDVEIISLNRHNNAATIEIKDDEKRDIITIKSTNISFFHTGWVLVEMEE